MRIGGIASGIDTESIIKQLMQVERQPLDRFSQKKQTLEWQRDSYREMNLKLRALEESAASIRLRSNLNTREATSSNTSMFTATANSSVENGTYNFRVNSIATKTTNISQNKITVAGDPPPTQFSASTTLDTQGASIGNVSAYHNSVFSISTYDANGVEKKAEITVDTSKSLNDMLKQINDSDIGVRAYYDSAFDKLVIERKETGTFNKQDGTNTNQVVFGGDTSFLNNVLHIHQGNEVGGKNADVEFQNPLFPTDTIQKESRSNSITIGGIAFSVKATTNGVFEQVTVTSNTDDAFNKIKAFVEKYNETIAEIQAKVNEPTYRDFPPLTDEQRQEISEREAELWDEKAKSGLLRRDQTLSSALTTMRNNIYTPVQTTGQFNQITQIGITTTNNFRAGGRLEIDETKLKAALAEDPDSVHQLFNNLPSTDLTNKALTESETGIIGRLRTSLKGVMDKVVDKAGNEYRTSQQFTIGKELTNVDKQITDFQRRLSQIEDRYWAQFTRMETAMNQANAQSSALMNQLGMGMSQ
ncbi:flagellar hook-associated protein 2 [Bacillus suaedae]|uniref:Flagellar hook-associated protein 2 n=1 Tax=Halalkalibacter suaedae TaxID=2822140 RepID=A0A940WTA2_9BACI|nr:flagellar hook-associated protein 2 [Bacillus suaedae]MBP3950032.1 flagellar hook-associated protein 2 [Bacillus suaedae]